MPLVIGREVVVLYKKKAVFIGVADPLDHVELIVAADQ